MAPKTTEQLLQDIAELQNKVSSLHKQRNLKEAELKTLKANKKLSELTSSSSSSLSPSSLQQHSAKQQQDGNSLKDYGIEDTDSSEILLASSAALAADAQQWQLESAYRMGGVTTFAVKDPGPDRTGLLGVRIEVFVGKTFQTPYYIILSPYNLPTSSSKSSGSSTSTSTNPLSTPSNLKNLSTIHLTPHRHTIPSFFVPLFENLVEKYLPPPPTTQNLLQVVKEVRRVLVLYHTRLHHLENVEGRINTPRIEGGRGVYVSGFKVDPEARILTVEWSGGSGGGGDEDEDEEMEGVEEEKQKDNRKIAVIAITEEGKVSGVIVKAGGKRVRVMERRIMGDGDGDSSGSGGKKKKSTTLAQVLGEEDRYDMPIKDLAERLVWSDGSGDGVDDVGDVTM